MKLFLELSVLELTILRRGARNRRGVNANDIMRQFRLRMANTCPPEESVISAFDSLFEKGFLIAEPGKKSSGALAAKAHEELQAFDYFTNFILPKIAPPPK